MTHPRSTQNPSLSRPIPIAARPKSPEAHLASSGIDAIIVDEVEGGMLPVEGEASVSVLVPAQDAELARQLLTPDGRT